MSTTTPLEHDIKLVFVDLDGTLLNDQHQLSERNREALQRALDKGVQVVLATGKTRQSAQSLIAALNLQSPGIFVQGLITYNADGSIRHQQTLDAAAARRIITFAEDRGFAVLAYSGNRLLIKSQHPTADRIAEFGEPLAENVGPLVNLLTSTPIHKFIIFGERKRLTALRWQLEQQLEGQIATTTAKVLDTLEVLPAGASKGRAAKKLMKELGVKPENALAIGDGENDVELLQAVGVRVAVENADPKLKAVAQYTVATNNDAGVAEAIERFVAPLPTPEPEPEPTPATATTPDASTAQPADAPPESETTPLPQPASPPTSNNATETNAEQTPQPDDTNSQPKDQTNSQTNNQGNSA